MENDDDAEDANANGKSAMKRGSGLRSSNKGHPAQLLSRRGEGEIATDPRAGFFIDVGMRVYAGAAAIARALSRSSYPRRIFVIVFLSILASGGSGITYQKESQEFWKSFLSLRKLSSPLTFFSFKESLLSCCSSPTER